MGKKILIAFDDSANASRAVDFVIETFSSYNRVTLFSVVPDTAALCEMNSPELTPYFKAEQGTFCTLEEQKKSLIQNAQQKGRQRLLDAGFPAENLIEKIEVKKKGIARDIVNEAGDGYDMIVMGRRGVSSIQDFFFGSIAQKIMGLARDVSILVVN